MTAAAESTPPSPTESAPESDPGMESSVPTADVTENPIEAVEPVEGTENPVEAGVPPVEVTENQAETVVPETDATATEDAVPASDTPDETVASEETAPATPSQAVPSPSKAVPSPSKALPSPAKAVPSPAEAVPSSVDAAPVETETEPWGRVDDDGTVSVREADGWRVVGQYPDGSADEALAYYRRKFSDLASEVALLEVRSRRGGVSPSDLRATARALHAKLQDAAAVGNLAALDARVLALTGTLAAASESEAAASRQAVDDAVRARTELVEKAEALAARDPRTVQWKQASVDLASLFDQWQAQQQNGPRLPKSSGQQLWKRFRDARAIVDKHRREFYAELDEAHKTVRDQKAKLVEKAEALGPKGEDGINAYRELLDQWKTAGRAGKKADDALWARFKAAGDALYSARGAREAADEEESREKIDAKRALLDEARAVADERDLVKARSALTAVQRRWDDIGRVFPRDKERVLDDDLRRIETALRTREETDWKRNNPETKARANDMTRQLTEAIAKLEDELVTAEKSGDKAAIANATEALEARRAWLNALGG
ncbi:DUF349 domain-containing protein [Microbacterium terregens]|uniref:DUF349 domain-containing protein n=1 Tax=Microbacterium terregens TaxID=69363 RepID=A0ABV5T1J5_9MICO